MYQHITIVYYSEYLKYSKIEVILNNTFVYFYQQQVRGYRMVKEGLKRRIIDIERERRRAQSLGCDRATLVRGPGTDQVRTELQFTIQN